MLGFERVFDYFSEIVGVGGGGGGFGGGVGGFGGFGGFGPGANLSPEQKEQMKARLEKSAGKENAKELWERFEKRVAQADSLLVVRKTAASKSPEISAADEWYARAWYLPLQIARKWQRLRKAA